MERQGGEAAPATVLDSSIAETTHRWPWFLPDGRHFLYYARGVYGAAVWVGDLDSKNRRRILDSSANAIYDSRGFLIFQRGWALLAQPWSAGRLQFTGDAFPIPAHVDVQSAAHSLVSLSPKRGSWRIIPADAPRSRK